jgi:hypothetical protein
VGASACLLGRCVRYDGTHRLDAWIAGGLGDAFTKLRRQRLLKRKPLR